MWEKIKRFGKYRVINAESRWGVDLFDDLEKLAAPQKFRAVVDVGANQGDFSKLFYGTFRPRRSMHWNRCNQRLVACNKRWALNRESGFIR